MTLKARFRRLVALLMLASPAACRRDAPPPPPRRTAVEVTGTPAERVEQVRRLLRVPPALAATIRDANSLEERLGDGNLGPSDFIGFQMLRVAPASVAAWRAILTPVDATSEVPVYTGPATPVSWWVSRTDFDALQFYSSVPLTGRVAGWVGLQPASGTIYIYSFTR